MTTFKKLKTDLEFALKNRKNVLLIGNHGVGKTAIIKELFEKYYKQNFRYYSASTMDPWVDFVGCPFKDKTDAGVEYLNLMRPKDFAEDTVKAIFIDEFNRSDPKTTNALMELIQFKSINNQKFKNLEVVWAGINPQNGNYKVDELDDAHKDRFHYIINVPSEPDRDFFIDKFGKDLALAAISWWENIEDELQKQISPRRLEYALDIIVLGGDVNLVLPVGCNPNKLLKEIGSTPVLEILKQLIKNNDEHAIIEFFNDDNKFYNTKEYVLKNQSLLKYLPDERISEMVSHNTDVLTNVLTEIDNPKFLDIINDIVNANQNKELLQKIFQNQKYQDYLIKNLHHPKLDETDAEVKKQKDPLDFIKKNLDILIGGENAAEVLCDLIEKNHPNKKELEDLLNTILHKGVVF